MAEMNRDEAKAYLKRKGEEESEENIKKCMREGKVFGDPLVELSGF